MNANEIVAKFAEKPPMVSIPYRDREAEVCAVCHKVFDLDDEDWDWNNPADHLDSCLWAQAKRHNLHHRSTKLIRYSDGNTKELFTYRLHVVGYIWMPRVMATYTYTLEAESDEEAIARVDTVAGDFCQVTDFCLSVAVHCGCCGAIQYETVRDFENEEAYLNVLDT